MNTRQTDVAEAPGFGVIPGKTTIDGTAVMNRVRSERDRFVGFVVDDVMNLPEEQRIHGHARFLDDHRIQIDDASVIDAKRIVISQAWERVDAAHDTSTVPRTSGSPALPRYPPSRVSGCVSGMPAPGLRL